MQYAICGRNFFAWSMVSALSGIGWRAVDDDDAAERVGALRAGCRWINLAAACSKHAIRGSIGKSYSYNPPIIWGYIFRKETSLTPHVCTQSGINKFRRRVDGLARLLDRILQIGISKVLLNDLGARIIKNGCLEKLPKQSGSGASRVRG